jgi:CO/xanthine dehydrogenase Mo-binding subunit
VLAGETNIEQAAIRLGIDPVELRRRNLVRPGEEILPGKRGIDADLPADLDLLDAALGRPSSTGTRLVGRGIACSASDAGAYPISTAMVRIQTDGSVIVSSGSTEMDNAAMAGLVR